MALMTGVLRRVAATSFVAAAVAVAPTLAASAQTVTLTGGGSTFIAPLYERWFSEFHKQNPNIQINYQAIGSGAGIAQFTAGTLDFGDSDAAMTDAQIAKVSKGVILVPVAGGGVSVTYNLPGVSNLKLSRVTLPAIFDGQITRWNDPRIQHDNPGVKLPNLPIRTVVRSDASGTSFIFTNYLAGVSPTFVSKVGPATTAPHWVTNPISAPGSNGVTASVKRVAGTIGYVELAYAIQNHLKTAELQTRQGNFVPPTLQGTNEALAAVKFPANFRVFVSDPAAGYPIAGLTWMMINKTGYTPQKAQAIKKLVTWMMTKGQAINAQLLYVRIPPAVGARVIKVVDTEVK